jgi:DNA-binding NtrC family response regulator
MPITDVLVVDDDIKICRIIHWMLSDEQYKVHTSQSVADALRVVDQKHFDAYVIDCILADGNGLEVAERVRTKWGATPIILISGYDPCVVALNAEKLRISEFLEKPFSRDIMWETVKNAIASRREAPKVSPVDPPASAKASDGRSWSRFWRLR